MTPNLPQFLLTTGATNAVYFLVAVIAWWGVLRILDILGGQKFVHLWTTLRRSPMALAIYLGARIIAVAVLAQAFLS